MKQFSPWLLIVLWLTSPITRAEQMQAFGDWEVHYALFPTEFLNPQIASQYQVTRGRDRALLNISVLDVNDNPVRAEVAGTMTNLLSQQQSLAFQEILEGVAVYYLAPVRHTDREVLRFRITIRPPGDGEKVLTFQQTMYWDNP